MRFFCGKNLIAEALFENPRIARLLVHLARHRAMDYLFAVPIIFVTRFVLEIVGLKLREAVQIDGFSFFSSILLVIYALPI